MLSVRASGSPAGIPLAGAFRTGSICLPSGRVVFSLKYRFFPAGSREGFRNAGSRRAFRALCLMLAPRANAESTRLFPGLARIATEKRR